jgi:bifunctional UDP-N-acetylglucosamine pyrophosphorylase/glucosamine-1-phosphate N-acetyltransferase
LGKIVIVVGYGAQKVKRALGDSCTYAFQKEQLGTGHALKCGLEEVGESFKSILVVYGDDSSFYRPETIKEFLNEYLEEKPVLSFIVLEKEDPTGLGRVVRDKQGQVRAIVEEREADQNQKGIKEVNDGCYVFNLDWLKSNLHKIERSASGEYYVTDLVKIALSEGDKVGVFKLSNSEEWVGVNTPEQLKTADLLMKRRERESRESIG